MSDAHENTSHSVVPAGGTYHVRIESLVGTRVYEINHFSCKQLDDVDALRAGMHTPLPDNWRDVVKAKIAELSK